MEQLLTNAETMRMGANMMIASGNDTLTDGTKFTMEVWDSWSEKYQRAFLCSFMIDRWDSLTPDQQAAEVSKMAQECHRCGKRGNDVQLVPDAGWGYSRLYCSDCALQQLMRPPGAQDEEMPARERQHPQPGWNPAPAASVRIHGLSARADLNGRTGKLIKFDEPSGRWGLRVDGTGEEVRIRPANFGRL